MERIAVGPGGTLVGSASGRRFKPWGQDQTLGPGGVGHKVNVADLREMKEMGANVVRLHLQFRHFMSSCTTPNPTALEELGETLRRAEENGVYLDLTGLGSFAGDAADPACYRNATEDGRWAAQAVFWRAVAREAARSPAVLALDLMNEPRVPDKREYCWVTCGSGFGRYFVQLISQTPLGRSRSTIARQWVTRMRDAIRAYDSKHLITLGCLPFPNCAGLDPATTAPLLNYLSVHINPDDGSTSDELDILAAYSATGDPVVVEETYPIRTADPAVMRSFLLGSRAHATGWLGHWGGKTLSQVMVDGDFRAAVWGLTFQRLTKTLSPCGACQP
jgi:hypothetical protein